MELRGPEDQYYEEQEERMYLYPRVAVLKNTNVEADMLARTRQETRNRPGGGYRRYQSPSPGPRQRHHNQAPERQHRSRRAYSDERDRLLDSVRGMGVRGDDIRIPEGSGGCVRGMTTRGDKYDNSYYNNSCMADTDRLIEEEMQYNA